MPQLLESATITISLDEPAVSLSELNLQAPDSKGWRRYQIIYVVRRDRIAEYREDLGLREAFIANEFRIPGGVYDEKTGAIECLHTVGELRDIADWTRARKSWAAQIEPRNILKQYTDAVEELPLKRRRISSFGPSHSKVRN